jgi:hypothetical protein
MAEQQQIPPASMSTLVQLLATQSMVAMGKMPVPGQEKVEPNFDLAKHFIDLLDVIEQKTKNNLSTDEHGMLTAVLHEMRMLYVSAKKGS